MQISEPAQRAGVSTKAVRYYEDLGLLAPSRLPSLIDSTRRCAMLHRATRGLCQAFPAASSTPQCWGG